MNIIHLPEKLLGTPELGPEKVMFYHHIGHDSHIRVKIAFDTPCIVLLLSGKKHLVAGDHHVFYDNRSCLLFKAGNYLSTELSADETTYHSLLIFFSERVLREFKHKYQAFLQAPKSESAAQSYLYFSTDEYLESFKLTARHTLQERNAFASSLQALKFEEIMLYLLERHGRRVLDFFDQPPAIDELSSFRKIVEANILGNMSIDDLAFLCAMSKSTFKRRFIEVYGKSPGQWQMEKRLDHSAFLLRVNQKNPSEIYEEVGFTNLSSFIQSFKKKFGRTPKQYQLN